jgi:hypothetical protein
MAATPFPPAAISGGDNLGYAGEAGQAEQSSGIFFNLREGPSL